MKLTPRDMKQLNPDDFAQPKAHYKNYMYPRGRQKRKKRGWCECVKVGPDSGDRICDVCDRVFKRTHLKDY